MKRIIAQVMLIVFAASAFLYSDSGNLVPYSEKGRCGYAERNMKIVLRPQFDTCGEMIHGIASVMKKGRYGFIDSSGKMVIPPVYESSSSFSEGYAVVVKNGRSAVIDRNGNPVIPFTDYSIESYSGGVAVISREHKYGLMGDGGKMILPVRFSRVEPAGRSLFIAAEASEGNGGSCGKHYLYNSSGAAVFSEGYDIISPDAYGFMKMSNGGKWGYLSPEGDVIAPAIYENICDIKRDGTACIRSRGKWGVMNGRGKIIVSAQYDSVGCADVDASAEAQSGNSWFTVSSGGRWGIISLRGESIAPLEYRVIGSGRNGYIPVFKDTGKSGGAVSTGLTLLDSRGWELFTPRTDYNCAGDEGEGLLAAGRTGSGGRGRLMGYINLQGESVISMEYDDAGEFSGGFAVVKKNGLYGVIDKRGRLVENTVYDYIRRSAAYPGLFEAALSGKKVYLEPGGRHFWK